MCTNLGYLTLEGPGRQELGGMAVQTSYVGGRWHQNWAHTSPQHIFMFVHGNWRKGVFFRTQKFSTGNFFGASTHWILTHSGFRKYSWFWWPSLRFQVIAAQSEAIGQKWVALRKIREKVSKRGSTSACRNSALKTPHPPFSIHILNPLEFQDLSVLGDFYVFYHLFSPLYDQSESFPESTGSISWNLVIGKSSQKKQIALRQILTIR